MAMSTKSVLIGEERMKRAVLMILMFGMPGANAEIAQCSSYYLKRIGFSVVSQLWLLSTAFPPCVGGRSKSGRNLRWWAAFCL